MIEIDDRMPCDSKKKLLMPRTTDPYELWPQLLVKAFFKAYTFKWYPSAKYELETGDGSFIHALTGLIPEKKRIIEFEKDGLDTLRKNLSDDHYFHKKTYVMAYCNNNFKPSFPSQKPPEPERKEGEEYEPMTLSFKPKTLESSQKKLLAKLKKVAQLALAHSTGKKLNLSGITSRQSGSNVITGFGYALDDLFENEDVNMDTVVKKELEMDGASPFRSPKRKGKKKKKRRKPKEEVPLGPPEQYKMIKLKTSIANTPIINVHSQFSMQEITLAKKCKLNNWNRPPPQLDPNHHLYDSPETTAHPKKAGMTGFSISPEKIATIQEEPNETESPTKERDIKKAAQIAVEPIQEGEGDEEQAQDLGPVFEPKTRASGGNWILADDFPHVFQFLMLFHNPKKFETNIIHSDRWTDKSKPYRMNEEDIYIKISKK